MANLPTFLKEDFGIDAHPSKLIDIAVIGSRGCGKTAFVQNAARSFFPTLHNEALLQPGEKCPSSSCSCSPTAQRLPVGLFIAAPCTFVKLQPRAGMWQSARLIEVDLGLLKYGRMHLKDLPRFDGVILCYDSLVPASYETLPTLMRASVLLLFSFSFSIYALLAQTLTLASSRVPPPRHTVHRRRLPRRPAPPGLPRGRRGRLLALCRRARAHDDDDRRRREENAGRVQLDRQGRPPPTHDKPSNRHNLPVSVPVPVSVSVSVPVPRKRLIEQWRYSSFFGCQRHGVAFVFVPPFPPKLHVIICFSRTTRTCSAVYSCIDQFLDETRALGLWRSPKGHHVVHLRIARTDSLCIPPDRVHRRHDLSTTYEIS